LILLDVSMPFMDGFAVCRLLKANPLTRTIPVIFITANNDIESRLEGFRLGAVDFVSKPFSAQEVRARIQVHLSFDSQGPSSGKSREVVDPLTVADVHVRAALRYIDENLHELLSVQEIASAVGISGKRMREMFKDRLGITVVGYVAEHRMSLGRHLLLETDMPIQDVAMEVGFKNPGNFATAFRERMGLTPIAYRQALKLAPPNVP
jgi:transcriptional regulator GlxA family with amidase domain